MEYPTGCKKIAHTFFKPGFGLDVGLENVLAVCWLNGSFCCADGLGRGVLLLPKVFLISPSALLGVSLNEDFFCESKCFKSVGRGV